MAPPPKPKFVEQIVEQTIFTATFPPIRVQHRRLVDLISKKSILTTFLASCSNGRLGLAPVYAKDYKLRTLAVATDSRVLVIDVSTGDRAKGHLKDRILCNSDFKKSAFRMDRLACALFQDLGIPITNATDLLSVVVDHRDSSSALLQALGGECTLRKQQALDAFARGELHDTPPKETALQAWAACVVPALQDMVTRVSAVPIINTDTFSDELMSLLATTLRHGDRLHALKPTHVKNEIKDLVQYSKGTLNVISTRFKSRIRREENQRPVQVKMTGKDGAITTAKGRVKRVNGKAVAIDLNGLVGAMNKLSVTTIGRDPPTQAEELCSEIILKVLKRSIDLDNHKLFSKLFFAGDIPSAPSPSSSEAIPIYFPDRPLNDSQARATRAILAKDEPVVMIAGPPGTGKTTVIAAAVMSLINGSSRDETIWCAAQSNVAVKNIAEKLASVDFEDFRVVVSKDFHFDWHEHLYTKIENKVIVSDALIDPPTVILCTLSTLTNTKMACVYRPVPLKTLILDEASQIEVGAYLPMLVQFRRTLEKVVFIGDDKQLPPYGQSDVPGLKSIFEFPHLENNAYFLDTQYRMPSPIANFISQSVYKGKLKTVHAITSPSCLRYCDVANGQEQLHGKSWINQKEATFIRDLAAALVSESKSFRIITPYDAQRGLLERTLKDAGLPWENKVYNVDSFQGNEDDYIIISVVRTGKVGFLNDKRRTNVMLTRCKKGMIVVTNRRFLEGKGASTLVGRLAIKFGPSVWLPPAQI